MTIEKMLDDLHRMSMLSTPVPQQITVVKRHKKHL